MSDSIVIAVDGPAASGKGTIARRLAAHFDFAYLDTGRLYRAIALGVMQAGSDPTDTKAVVAIARALDLNALDALAETDLRTGKIGMLASQIAAQQAVRAVLIAWQRDFARTPPNQKAGAVLDGRDIGTVICPEARVKFFITARSEIRATRRWHELRAHNPHDPTCTLEAVLADIRARDAQDKERETAPLRQAENAYLIDTSNLSIEESVLKALAHIDFDAPQSVA